MEHRRPARLIRSPHNNAGRGINQRKFMSEQEAKDYADIVIEALYAAGVITESAYGKIPVNLVEDIASKLIEASNE